MIFKTALDQRLVFILLHEVSSITPANIQASTYVGSIRRKSTLKQRTLNMSFKLVHPSKQGVGQILGYVGPTLAQLWANASCLLG